MFNHMTSQEVEPDGMSYYLATRASFYHALLVFKSTKKRLQAESVGQSGEESLTVGDATGGGEMGEEEAETEKKVELDLSRTLELCSQCARLEPKLATKGYRFIVGALLREVNTL